MKLPSSPQSGVGTPVEPLRTPVTTVDRVERVWVTFAKGATAELRIEAMFAPVAAAAETLETPVPLLTVVMLVALADTDKDATPVGISGLSKVVDGKDTVAETADRLAVWFETLPADAS